MSPSGTILEGWLALAAETKRVDRLSSTLGLDSPRLSSSTSSLGSSCGSPGLNAPSLNAFRFLPFLQDISPELLQQTSRQFEHLSNPSPPPLTKRALKQSPPTREARTLLGRPVHLTPVTLPQQSQESSLKAYPFPTIQNNSETSYFQSSRFPAWPAARPAPLTTDFAFDSNVKFNNMASPLYNSSPMMNQMRNSSSGLRKSSYAPDFDMHPSMENITSPMLSETFHRMVVHETDPLMSLSLPPPQESDDIEEIEMRAVTEESEGSNPWWNDHDPTAELTFEFDSASNEDMFHFNSAFPSKRTI